MVRDAQTAHSPTHADPRLTPAEVPLARGIRGQPHLQPLAMMWGLQAHAGAEQPGWHPCRWGRLSSEQPQP